MKDALGSLWGFFFTQRGLEEKYGAIRNSGKLTPRGSAVMVLVWISKKGVVLYVRTCSTAQHSLGQYTVGKEKLSTHTRQLLRMYSGCVLGDIGAFMTPHQYTSLFERKRSRLFSDTSCTRPGRD